MPPSPVVITFRGCSEKHASGPSEPIGRPCSGADGARGVLDHGQAVALGQREEGSMSAGRPIWWTGMIACVRARDRVLGGRRVEVVGQRVDVGEHRRRAALPDSVGGRDERQRGHDHLVAWADSRDVERQVQRAGAVGRGDRLRAPTRSAKAASKACTRGPCDTQPDAMAAATASASPPVKYGRVNGTSITTLAPASRRHGGSSARSARHHSTSRVKPSSRSISASKPSRSRAREVSASRRGTLLRRARARDRPAGRSP